MPTSTNRTQTIVAGSALLLIVALACAAAKSLLLFVVVAYVCSLAGTSQNRKTPPPKQATRSRPVNRMYPPPPSICLDRQPMERFEPFDLDEMDFDDSSDDFPVRRIAIVDNVAGYINCGCDPSGMDIHGNDATGFDPMGCDHVEHTEFDDHLFRDFIDSGNQSTPIGCQPPAGNRSKTEIPPAASRAALRPAREAYPPMRRRYRPKRRLAALRKRALRAMLLANRKNRPTYLTEIKRKQCQLELRR